MSHGMLSAISLFFILTSGVSLAQGARTKEVSITPSAESQAALVRHSFENELQSILEKYLKPHQYAIDVNFTMPANLKGLGDVPYAPDSIIPESFQGLPSAEQLKKLQDLQVRVLVPQWMDAQTKSTLQSLLSKRLQQLTGSLVKLELQSVPLQVEEPPKPVAGLPSMGAADSQKSAKDLADLKAEMQKERDQYKEDMKDLQDKLASSEKTNPLTPASASKSSFQDFWEFAKSNPVGAGVVLLLIYAGIFTLAFLPSRSMASGLGSIQAAFGAIAKSIKGVADSMARSGTGGSSNSEGSERNASPSMAPAGASAAVAATSRSQQPSYPELKEILVHLQKQHTIHSDPIVIEMLQSFLGQGSQNFKAVLVLELLGPQHSNRIFDHLSSEQKDQLLRLIGRAETSVFDKTEALYELAEAYQTRLLAAGWKGGTRASLDQKLHRLLGSLKSEDLALVARQLKSEEDLRRFMLYLDAPSLVQLLQSFKRNADEKNLILSALAAMPEALDSGHADEEIEAVVETFLSRKREDRYLPYLAHFEAIVAQSGEDMEDDLIEQISRSNPVVGRHLRRKVITIGSFFTLPDSVRVEVLGPFSNYEVAVLLSAFPDEQKRALLMNALEARRRELVQEQMHMLVDENKYALADSQKNMKTRLKEALRVIRANQDEHGGESTAESDSPEAGAKGTIAA